MKKRTFIKTTSALVVGAAVSPMAACKSEMKDAAKAAVSESAPSSDAFTLPDLPYGFDAL